MKIERFGQSVSMDAAQYETLIAPTLEKLKKENFVGRFWSKDAALWKKEAEHQKIIQNSLGWLAMPEFMSERLGELVRFSEEVKQNGWTDLVLLGMGGSSLSVELFRLTLPSNKGYPKLHVLDSTDPGWIHGIEKAIQLKKTLFIVSSKSGNTIEPLSFFKYFFERTSKKGGQFIAITDAGSYLENLAQEKKFLKTFLNPSDIGGRYSALSYFGLAPAALAGMDVRRVVESSVRMMHGCGPKGPLEKNPGVQLGIVLAQFSKSGRGLSRPCRDKVTLLTSKKLQAFGLWIEQLVAESSGKEGKGLVPIVGESVKKSDLSGNDRLCISVYTGPHSDRDIESELNLMEKNHPVVRIAIKDLTDLGGEFVRWEIATAVACSLLGVNAFDQPDVQAAKDKTQTLLKELIAKGFLPKFPVHFQGKRFKATFSQSAWKLMAAQDGGSKSEKLLKKFIEQICPGDFLALLAFLPSDNLHYKKLQQLQILLNNRTKTPAVVSYGPRYLHSTGQLHKGGANSGVFILLTADPAKEIKIPGERYTFGELEMAQALGDFQALESKGRRAVWIHLQLPLSHSLEELQKEFIS